MDLTIEHIEKAVMALSEEDFRQLYERMHARDQKTWDRQIAEDSDRGAFDDLITSARSEHEAKQTRSL